MHDVRIALRQLIKSPGFTLGAADVMTATLHPYGLALMAAAKE